ncbi:MerR family transcriptional regulator [Bifidobacterium bombi]|uniref:Transcriptional regulator, MerR family n=1 Tax=Bifidobacterium bombi DSM 19703 TaxID=1341695 RepID=A0A080N346_9BIFI|nr:MerR family transcriptional regulator [Bifidobacterium bombi]KFF31336.1 transcriptional regulator, MerR family [Bifidobacterium bombi DSM 19703]
MTLTQYDTCEPIDAQAADIVPDVMAERWSPRWHTIREASLYCGLSESTLRYYEQVGIISGIRRDPISGHRIYDDDDLAALTTISCLSATGMPLADMREYMAQRSSGKVGAQGEVELLQRQRDRLEAERNFLEARSEYVGLKIQYWAAVADGDDELAGEIGAKAAKKAETLGQQASMRQHNVK